MQSFKEALFELKMNKKKWKVPFEQKLLGFKDFSIIWYIYHWSKGNQEYFIDSTFNKKTLSFLQSINFSLLFPEKNTRASFEKWIKIIIDFFSSKSMKDSLITYWFTMNDKETNLDLESQGLFEYNELEKEYVLESKNDINEFRKILANNNFFTKPINIVCNLKEYKIQSMIEDDSIVFENMGYKKSHSINFILTYDENKKKFNLKIKNFDFRNGSPLLLYLSSEMRKDNDLEYPIMHFIKETFERKIYFSQEIKDKNVLLFILENMTLNSEDYSFLISENYFNSKEIHLDVHIEDKRYNNPEFENLFISKFLKNKKFLVDLILLKKYLSKNSDESYNFFMLLLNYKEGLYFDKLETITSLLSLFFEFRRTKENIL